MEVSAVQNFSKSQYIEVYFAELKVFPSLNRGNINENSKFFQDLRPIYTGKNSKFFVVLIVGVEIFLNANRNIYGET